jgi:hypothetical protein
VVAKPRNQLLLSLPDAVATAAACGAVDGPVIRTDGVVNDVRLTASYVWKSRSRMYILINLEMVED